MCLIQDLSKHFAQYVIKTNVRECSLETSHIFVQRAS